MAQNDAALEALLGQLASQLRDGQWAREQMDGAAARGECLPNVFEVVTTLDDAALESAAAGAAAAAATSSAACATGAAGAPSDASPGSAAAPADAAAADAVVPESK
jgi:hypothetical protein